MVTLCPEGKAEITITDQEELDAYEDLLDYYDGDEARAYEAFYQEYRTNRSELQEERMSSYTMEDFTVSQQQQTVDLMKWYTMKILTWNDGQPHSGVIGEDGLPNINMIKNEIRGFFNKSVRKKHSNSESRQKAIDRILENYDQFWRRTHERLKDIGLEVNDDGGIQEIAGGDFVRRNWDDNARFEIDPKSTASAKVKAALSFIPKVKYVRDEDGNVEKENGVKKKTADEGFLGPRFASLDTIHDNIGRALSDFIPPKNEGKFEAYVDKLTKEFEGNNAQLERAVEEVIEKGKEDTTFKFDFVNAFGKTYTQDLTVTFKPNVYTDQTTGRQVTSGWTMRVFDTNRTSQQEALKNQWFENQKDLPIVSQDQDADLRIDKSAVEDLRNQYINEINEAFNSVDDKTDEEVLSVVQDYLGKVGITVPIGVLEKVANNPDIISTQDHTWNYHIGPNNGGLNSKGLMGAIFNTLGQEITSESEVEESEYGKLGLNNPIYGRDSQGLVNKLASLAADTKSSVYAPSYINGENNQVFALQDHTILTKTFGELTQRPEDALRNEGVFNRQSKVLEAIQNNEANIREIFDLHYTDVLREYRRTRGTSYDQMSTAEKELTRLGLFQRPQRNGRVRFVSPTLSDKTREYVITLPKIQNLFNEDKWLTARNTTISKDGELNLYNQQDGKLYSGIEGRVLYNMAKGEIKRIINAQNWLRNNDPSDHPLGEEFIQAAQRFLLFPELNPENLSDEDVGKIYRTNEANEISDLKDPVNNDTTRDAIERVLLDRLAEKVENTKNRWEDLGIAEGNSAEDFMMDSSYLRSIPFRMDNADRKLTYTALDYQLSQRFFNSNILQMLPGDPAQHVKGNLNQDDSLEVHEQTMTNLQKRLANHIAPGLTADWVNGQTDVKILTMNDRIVASKHWDQYKDMLDGDLIDLYGEFDEDGNLVDGIESTDAQEYTTFKEHLIMARSHGKVKKSVFNKLINKIDEVRQDPNNPNNYFKIEDVLTEEEYRDFYLMPHKPVLVGEEYYDHLDNSHVIYRKTSSWPLIPEMVKGTDLDNLRMAMEGTGTEERVQRAAFQSADKLGAYNPVDVFQDNERKTFEETDLYDDEDRGLVDYFKSFDEVDNPNNANIQVVNRDNLALQFELPYNDKGVKTVSQMNRLLPQDIKDIPDFLINGEEMNGKQVDEYKQDLRKQMFNAAREQLFDDLGVNVIPTDSGEKYEFEDMEALQSVLLEEARARDWDPSSIDALELTEDGEFAIPLSFTPNTESVESLLNSLIDNRVIEQRIYGSSYVQTSGAGWHGIGNSSPIAVTESYDPEQGVQHIRKDENGEVQPAQAMIPWNFKDENGNLLPINDYTKTIETEDGDTRRVIDDEKLDPQIRKMIGARIPYQSKSSSMPIEIVGFLPPTVKKLMVVSDETVAQMGSDFDVDKVTTYEYKYTLTPDGRLAASQSGDSNMSEMDEIKKNYKDLHWEVLTHPDVMPQIVQPLDSPYLSDEADRIEGMKPQSDDRTDFLDPHQQVDDHDNQQAGNDLIGIFSNFSNLNSMIEAYPQEMKGSIPDGDEGSRTVDRIVRYRRREGGNVSEYKLTQIGGENADVQMPDGSTGTIGDVLEMLQNASLDNAKELVLDKLNATTNTANVMSALAMLNNGENGIPLDQFARFFAQPAIKRLDSEIDRLESQLNEEFVSEDTQEKAIQRVLSDLAENYATNEEEEIDQDKYDSIYNSLSRESIEGDEVVNAEIPSLRELTNALKKPFDSQDSSFIQTQRDVLDAYLGLYEISKALNQIQGTVNWGNRNGPGKSLLHSKNKTQAYNNLAKNKIFDDPVSIVKNPDGSLTEWGSAAHNSFILANELYSDLFHYNSTVFETVKSEMDQQTDNGISPDKALEIFRNLRSFVFSSEGMLNMEGFTVEGERQRLLFGDNNIASKVKEAQDDWGMENFFVQRLRPEQPEGSDDPATVDYSADKGDKLDEIRVIQDFAGMLTSNDDRKRELARDLVRYSFLVGGGAQSPTSFHNKVPIGYLIQEGLKESIDKFDFENDSGTSERFKQQYYQHNPKDARVLSDQEVDIIKNNQTDQKLRRLDIIPDDVPSLFDRTVDGIKPKYEYISLYDTSTEKWRLYKSKGDRTYYEIDKLGDKPSVKEYNVNKDKTIQSSLIEENHSELDYNPFSNEGIDPNPVNDKSIPLNKAIEERDQISSEKYLQKVRDHVGNDPYLIEMLEFVEDTDMDFEIIMLSDQQIKNKWNQDYTSDAKFDASEPNRIYLNEDILKNESDEFIGRTVLHEWIHKQTSKVHNMNENQRTDRQQELMLNIYNLMNEAVQKDGENAPSSIFEIKENGKFKRDENGNRIPNFMEFISWAVANKQGQEWLNDIEVGDKNKSMLDKIIDMISEVVTSVIEASGFDISENSTLRHTIKNTLNLIETTKVRDNPKSNPESKSKEERAEENQSEENEFISDEELLGYAEDTQETMSEDDVTQMFEESKNQRRPLEQQGGLDKTIGELRSTLSDRQKEIFDEYRTRFQTRC